MAERAAASSSQASRRAQPPGICKGRRGTGVGRPAGPRAHVGPRLGRRCRGLERRQAPGRCRPSAVRRPRGRARAEAGSEGPRGRPAAGRARSGGRKGPPPVGAPRARRTLSGGGGSRGGGGTGRRGSRGGGAAPEVAAGPGRQPSGAAAVPGVRSGPSGLAGPRRSPHGGASGPRGGSRRLGSLDVSAAPSCRRYLCGASGAARRVTGLSARLPRPRRPRPRRAEPEPGESDWSGAPTGAAAQWS